VRPELGGERGDCSFLGGERQQLDRWLVDAVFRKLRDGGFADLIKGRSQFGSEHREQRLASCPQPDPQRHQQRSSLVLSEWKINRQQLPQQVLNFGFVPAGSAEVYELFQEVVEFGVRGIEFV
jgi:hypothetical protein